MSCAHRSWIKPLRWLPFVACLGASCLTGAAEMQDDEKAVRSVADAYSANRKAFSRFDCQFRYITHRPKSMDDALAGGIGGQAITQVGRWCVDGGKTLYELRCPAEVNKAMSELIASSKAAEITLDCNELFYLRRLPDYALRYNDLGGVANLFTAADAHGSGIRVTPFGMNVLGEDEECDPGRYVSSATSGKYPYRYLGPRKSSLGHSELVIEFSNTVTLGFDPERGYLLSSFYALHPRTREPMEAAYVLDAERRSNGAWFPTRCVRVVDPESNPPTSAGLIVVDELDTDNTPPPETFALELRAGTQVNRPGHSEWVTLTQSEIVSTESFEDLHRRCIEHGKREREMDRRAADARAAAASAAPPPKSRSNVVLGLTLFNGLLAIFLLRAALSRRAKPRSQ